MQRLPDSYMFSQHTRQTLTAWMQQLQFFYFLRALGGHANDDDTFQAGILYDNKSDLEYKLEKLGIAPGIIGPNDPQLIPGQSYRGDELANFKVPVYSYPDMEQPGVVSVAGQQVYVRIESTAINFSVSGTADGNLYQVTEADFIACLQIEKVFKQFNLEPFKDVSFEDSRGCFLPSNYSDIYQ
ncbi:MAG: hypothetical protein V4594_12400 [Bacteroidota bacterium]